MQEKIKNAIYYDETESYRIPWMPKSSDTVRVRIRVLKGSFSEINMVILGEESLPMSFEFSKGIFDYYFVELPPAEDAKEYLFELINEVEAENKKSVQNQCFVRWFSLLTR